MGGREGTIDTSLNPNDFMHNPGTQNNITDFVNRRVFVHTMKDPVSGQVAEGRTQHVLKGGEDSVGDRLALIRVYVNIGMCTEECWVPNFPYPGSLAGAKSRQKPFRVNQCSADCEAWNHADAKMGDLAFFLLSGGPTDLMKARDVDGAQGAKYLDLAQVPKGRDLFAKNCAGCHSSFVPPQNIREDKEALAAFFKGHAFGSPDTWQHEFTAAERGSTEFQKKYLARDPKSGRMLPQAVCRTWHPVWAGLARQRRADAVRRDRHQLVPRAPRQPQRRSYLGGVLLRHLQGATGRGFGADAS